MMNIPSDLLILRHEALQRNLSSLYQQLNDREDLRRYFVQNPAGVIAQTILPNTTIPSAKLNRANQLVFSLITNTGFMEWANQYQKSLTTRAQESTKIKDPHVATRVFIQSIDRVRMYKDLSEAILKHGDPMLVGSLIPGAGEIHVGPEADTAAVATDVVVAIEVAVAVAAVAFAVAFWIPPDLTLTRIDLERFANQLTTELTEQAHLQRTAYEAR